MSFEHFLPIVLTVCVLPSCMTTSSEMRATVSNASIESAEVPIAPSAHDASSADAQLPPAKGPSNAWSETPSYIEALSVEPVAPKPPTSSSAPVAAEKSDKYPGKGSWEFLLGGSGSADKHFDTGGFSLTGSLGYYLTDVFEISARQNATYADFGSSQFTGQTRVALDFNLLDGPVRPVIGANIGYVYGDLVHDTWSAAPEVGVKIYLAKNVFLSFMGEYQFFFDKGNDIDDQFDTGAFLFEVGLGMNF